MIASVDDPRPTVDDMLILGKRLQDLLPRGLHPVSLKFQNVGVSNASCEGINFAAWDESVDPLSDSPLKPEDFRVAQPIRMSVGALLMESYSDGELETMLLDLKSDLVARKESMEEDAPRKVRATVCAFANDRPNHSRPGVVFIGASDKGQPTGLPITDPLLLEIARIKSDGDIVPPPTLTVDKRNLLGSEIVVVAVQPADSPPVRYRGRIWIRVGPGLAVATAQDERILNEKRRTHDKHFDSTPLRSSTIGDLDLRRFDEDYLPQAVTAADLATNDRTSLERLAATKMIASINDPAPTVGGMLILGKRPQDFLPEACIQFLRIAGNRLNDEVVDKVTCYGSITEVVRRLEEKLTAYNRTAVDFMSAPLEVRCSTYPLDALRPLVRNAVMHRTYEGTNAPVRVLWLEDRIEIISPGGPYGAVTVEDFGLPGVVDYRNPFLAEAMRVLGLVQRFGLGIQAAKGALLENGNPELEFELKPNWVHCTVRAQS